jgi:hypothetical protein
MSDKFVWTDGTRRVEDLAHDDSSHGAPAPKETLLYISASTQVLSVVQVPEQHEEGQPYPV